MFLWIPNHSIDVMKQKAKQKAKQKPAVEISKWCTKLKKPTESTQKMISELAVKGMSFQMITNVKGMKRAYSAIGHKIPDSANTVRAKILEYYEEKKEDLKSEIKARFDRDERCSASFDEFTSKANRRFLTLNIFFKDAWFNLGIFRMKGSYPAERLLEMIDSRLKEFNIDLNKNCVCNVPDGAPIMQKLGRLCDCLLQCCYNHAIHLSVCDVLYTKTPKISAFFQPEQETEVLQTQDDDDSSGDEDDENTESFGIESIPSNQRVPLNIINNVDHNKSIKKVQEMVRLFRKSPVRNDGFQKHLEENTESERILTLPDD